ALAVDRQGQLWVAEDDAYPRRVSVWDAKTGAFKREYFGATHYGATGGAVLPTDKHVVIGQGCEWRIDPQTGKSVCLGTITREGMGGSRFGFGQNGRLYLATTPGWLHGPNLVHIYERLGEANYKRRATLKELTVEVPPAAPAAGAKPNKNAKPTKVKKVEIWSDVNDDAQVQPDEVKTYDVQLGGWISGWYMPFTADMTFYGTLYKVGVTGWTACGAPLYDLTKATKLPIMTDSGARGGMGSQRGCGSVDGRFMLWNAAYGVDHGTMDCFDLSTGKHVWTYPSNFVGVHGSHRATPAEPGLMRGAYDIAGVIKLPAPIGNAWVVPTNKGEWHILTERGFYLTRLFEGETTRVVWPKTAAPGMLLDTVPPGSGEEAFGGSLVQHPDGSVTVQAGHTSFWNCEVVGLDKIRAIPGGTIAITQDDTTLAQAARAKQLQQAAGPRRLDIGKATPTFTGDLDKDFAGATVLKYAKSDATAVRTAAAYDANFLYVAWEVKDATPWVNGADAPEFMYARGDTVDLQLGTDPAAKRDRREAVAGDVRLSIGNYRGQPTVVAYRKVAAEKNAKTFSSGVQKGYVMDSVTVLKDAKVQVTPDVKAKRYTVELALPLALIDLKPAPGAGARIDFGVTHGDAAGADTQLRTHWSNQDTGLVSDEVYELKMNPGNWGDEVFK
ncbi:MAG: hypothetical protein ACAI43_10540, partial [Phycisphaerae bacterium]